MHTFKRAHDFGVNSIDALELNNETILIASGGDDQQLSIIHTDLSNHKLIKFYGHSSSIKGVSLSQISG